MQAVLAQGRVMHKLMQLLSLVVFSGMLLVHSPAFAKSYKCRDAAGNTSYSQNPCASGSSQKTLTGPASDSTDADVCVYLGGVAETLHQQMKHGADAGTLIDRHGTLATINPRMLNIINYVGGFRFNKDVTSQRVGQLALLKCQNGGFGAVSMTDMPMDPEERMRYEQQQAHKQAMQPPVIQQQKTISVSFTNTPVAQAIKEIASKAGVPINIHGTLAGVVSMQLDNVPWQQPLTAIVLQHNFQMGGGADGVWIAPH